MDEEINIIQKRIMDLIGKIQDEFTNGSSNVVRAAENMNEALAFEKKREAGREINSELHNLFIRRDELLTKSEGYTHTIFSKHNFEKLKEDAENKCFNNYTSPFINFLTKDEKNATEFRSIYEKGIHFAVERLASYGWYINYLFKPLDIIQAATYTNNLDSKKLDEFMFQMIESNLVSIKETLTNRHKKREKIFDALFKAHFQKEYYLSIPVIFTQCDGISKDATNYIFFKNSSKKFGYSPIITDWANNEISLKLHKSLAAALFKKGAFQIDKSAQSKIEITRHSILHGESIDYGTKINSLKAISLLIYLSDITSSK